MGAAGQTPEQVIRRTLDGLKAQSGELDGTDDSIWFVHGALRARNERGDTALTTDAAALALYVAELLAARCRDVDVEIVASQDALQDINAVQRDGAVELVLNWVWQCLLDPDADNIVFKYAGALRDFGEHERAQRLIDALQDDSATRQ